ncbi:hypothetical protein SLEP1_g18840 [Rubroshorea leprosula]|uniref:Uncharacterized protein n=1 Tax=Rubroshorea leprosula TaxID=152421 RepID=A0AAV5J9H0_9ROSI|nr:hypothetical protein SLEP1_g18840 [Rubroshorea leprosula]
MNSWLLLALPNVEGDMARIQVTTSKDKGKKATKEPNPKSNKDNDMKPTKSDEASRVVPEKRVPYLVVALKKSIPNEDEIDVDEPAMSISKKVVSFGKILSEDESSSVLAKLSDVDDIRNKAEKVMIGNAFINLYATVRHMEVTLFVKMVEEFFHYCRDAIDDAKSINFRVGAIWASEGVPWQRQKSLVNMKELMLKLEATLKSAEEHLKLLSQEKECLGSSKVA